MSHFIVLHLTAQIANFPEVYIYDLLKLKNAFCYESGNLIIRHTDNALQDILVMFAQQGRALYFAGDDGQQIGLPRDTVFPYFRMVHLLEEMAVLKLRVVLQQVPAVLQHPCCYPLCLHQAHDVFRRVPHCPRLYLPVQLILVFLPGRKRSELRVIRPCRVAHNPTEALPLLLGEYGNSAPSVVTRQR